MRSTVGRVAFRGAAQYLLANSTRCAPVLALHSTKKRELCSGTVPSNDINRTFEDSGASKVSAILDQTGDPPIQIITEDEVALASQAIPDESLDQSVVVSGGEKERSLKRRDPEILKKTLSELLSNGSVRSALWHFVSAMDVEGQPGVSEEIVRMMLPVLGRQGWAPSSRDTLLLALKREYNIGVGLYNCGLHAMSRVGNTKQFTEILDGMWDLPRESQPNSTSYTYLIGTHVYGGKIDGAFEVLNEMKARMIYPNFATYHALITGCLRKRDPARAFSTLLAVEKHRFEVSAMTIAQVLVASAQSDHFDNVLLLISKLEEALPMYASQLHRIAEGRHMYRIKSIERTSKEERAELRGAPKPEIGAISAVLHCAFRGARPDIAEAGWGLLNRYYPGMKVPSSLWYCMIGAYAGANEFSKAFDVLGAMREAGETPQLRDLDMALIRPLSHDVAKIDEQFFRLVDRHENVQVTTIPGDEATSENNETSTAPSIQEQTDDEMTAPDTSVSDMEISTEQLDASTPDGSSLADILTQPDLPSLPPLDYTQFAPTTVGIEELNCVIAACSRSGDLDRAFQTYDEVESRFGLERNIATYNALLEGCVQVRHIRGGLRVLEEMENMGIKPNEETTHLTVRLHLRARKLREAMDVVLRRRSGGDIVMLQTYHMLLRNALQMEDLDAAVQVSKEAEAAGFDRIALTGRLKLELLNTLRGALGEEPRSKDNSDVQDEVDSMDANASGGQDLVKEDLETEVEKQ